MSFRTDFGGTYYGSPSGRSYGTGTSGVTSRARDYGPSAIRPTPTYTRSTALDSPGTRTSGYSVGRYGNSLGRSDSTYSVNSDYNSLSRRTTRDTSPTRVGSTSTYSRLGSTSSSIVPRPTSYSRTNSGSNATLLGDTSTALNRQSSFVASTLRRPSTNSRRNSIDDDASSIYSVDPGGGDMSKSRTTTTDESLVNHKTDDIHLPPPKAPTSRDGAYGDSAPSYTPPSYSQQSDRDSKSNTSGPITTRKSSWRESVYGADASTVPVRRADPTVTSEADDTDTHVVSFRQKFRERKRERDRERQRELEKEREKYENEKTKWEIDKERRDREYQAELAAQKKLEEEQKEREKLLADEMEKEQAKLASRQRNIQRLITERPAYQDSFEKVADWQQRNYQQQKPSSAGSAAPEVSRKSTTSSVRQRAEQRRGNSREDDVFLNEEDEITLKSSVPQQSTGRSGTPGDDGAAARRRSRRHRQTASQEQRGTDSDETDTAPLPARKPSLLHHHHGHRKHSTTPDDSRRRYVSQHTDIDQFFYDKSRNRHSVKDAMKVLHKQGSLLFDEYYTTDEESCLEETAIDEAAAETLVYKSRRAKDVFETMPIQIQHLIIRAKGRRLRFNDVVAVCRNSNHGKGFSDEEERKFRGYKSANEMLESLGVDITKLEDCVLQLYRFNQAQAEFGSYLDLDLTLDEQWEEFEGYSENQKAAVVIRTKLLVRVKAIIEKLLSASGRELRRALFSLKQIFQDDKDLVHEFVTNGGLDCLIRVGKEADQNYQNYILRALGQVMLYVDGMNGVISHNSTVQWLYTLLGSKFRLVVKTALKLLLLFVEYAETNSVLFIKAVNVVHSSQSGKPWSYVMGILSERDGGDTELLTYTQTLVNKTLSGVPDQDTFYDVTDCLESQGMETVVQHHMTRNGADLDLLEQFQIYEASLKHEDGEGDLPVSRDNLRQVPRLRSEASDPRRSKRLQSVPSIPSLPITPSVRHSSPPASPTSPKTSSKRRGLGDASVVVDSRTLPAGKQNGSTDHVDSGDEITSSKKTVIKQKSIEAKTTEIPVDEDKKDSPPFSPTSERVQPAGQEAEPIEKEKLPEKSEAISVESKTTDIPTTIVTPPVKDGKPAPGKLSSSAKDAVQASLNKGPGSQPNDAKPSPSPSEPPPKPTPPPPPKKTDEEIIWERIEKNLKRSLRIKDLDFTDLARSDDEDALAPAIVLRPAIPNCVDGVPPPPPPPPPLGGFRPPPPPPPPPPVMGGIPPPPPPPPMMGGIPPPPPPMGLPPRPGAPGVKLAPPPPGANLPKTKKTLKLHWTEWKHAGLPPPPNAPKAAMDTIWTHLGNVDIDAEKLQALFENKSNEAKKEIKQEAAPKKIVVLDMKRSNAINIGMTVLPTPRTIKTAILKMDSSIINKEGIEKLLHTMIPTDEEKEAIIEAQMSQQGEGIPLGPAEQFLLTLSSITHLQKRLELWLFKLEYEQSEREIAEPLQDLKQGVKEIRVSKTFRQILALLLGFGNYLNGSQSRGFSVEYLGKLPEVKDTLHKHSLLHHLCTTMLDQFPDSTDLYSELGSICRCRRIEWEELALKLDRLERDCKRSWSHQKEITKADGPHTQQGMKITEFLTDATERIILLKVVHKRVINRFRSLLLFLGYPTNHVRDIKIADFCRLLAEFALEYRTTREKLVQQRAKKQNQKDRRSTRGKMIFDMDSNNSSAAPKNQEDDALKNLLKNHSGTDYDSDVSSISGVQRKRNELHSSRNSLAPSPSPRRASLGRASPGGSDVSDVYDTQDEMLDACLRSATAPNKRRDPSAARRKAAASKDRKSYRRTLVNGVSADDFNKALASSGVVK